MKNIITESLKLTANTIIHDWEFKLALLFMITRGTCKTENSNKQKSC